MEQQRDLRTQLSLAADADAAKPESLRAMAADEAAIAARWTPSEYAGDRLARATAIRVEIVREPKDQVGFAVLARRWVVERFFAWIGRNRRLAKDFEATVASANAFLYAASVVILLRRASSSCVAPHVPHEIRN